MSNGVDTGRDAKEVASAASRDGKRKDRRVAFVVLGLIFGFLGLAFGLSSCDDAPPKNSNSGNESLSAEHACEDQVRTKLKSPSSAQFSEVDSVRSAGKWHVSGVVDADNSFGASIRNAFSCDVRVTDDTAFTSNVQLAQ